MRRTAFEALFVPFLAAGDAFFSGVYRLGALGALGDLSGDETHRTGCSVINRMRGRQISISLRRFSSRLDQLCEVFLKY